MTEPGSPAQLIEERIDFIIRELDDFCGMTRNPETCGFIAQQSIGIGMIQFRAELILSFLAAKKAPQLKVISNG